MVGLGGLEPPTSPLSGVRSNQLIYRPNAVLILFILKTNCVGTLIPSVPFYGQSPQSIGGAEEDRTPDPLRARQVLSQLSYDPNLGPRS